MVVSYSSKMCMKSSPDRVTSDWGLDFLPVSASKDMTTLGVIGSSKLCDVLCGTNSFNQSQKTFWPLLTVVSINATAPKTLVSNSIFEFCCATLELAG